MKKAGIILLIIGILACIFLRFDEENICLLFYEQTSENTFYPYIAEWDYKRGEILFEDNALKITMLPLNYQPDILHDGQWFAKEPSDKTGRDIFVREENKLHTYHVQTASSSNYKTIELTKPDEITIEEWEQADLIKADYNSKSRELTFVMGIYTKEPFTLMIGKADWKSQENITWKIFKYEKEFPIYFQCIGNVILTGEWIYVNNGEAPVRISIKNGTVEILDELMQNVKGLKADDKADEELSYTRRIVPVGRQEDIILWEWSVVTKEDVEPIYSLFQEQLFLGAIHIQENGIWNVYDKNKEINKVDMNMVYQNKLYLPQ